MTTNLNGIGLQEFSWSMKGTGAYRSSLGFAERNVHHLRPNAASGEDWFSKGFARAYSVEDFTLVHAAGSGPAKADWCNREERDWEDISYDQRNRFALMLQISGERKITQMGRTQLVTEGHAAFFCTSEPYLMESRTLSERSEMIAFYLPSEYAIQRLVNPKRLCVRPQASALDRLAIETVKLFAGEAWALGKSEFYRTARIIANLILEAQDTTIEAMSHTKAGRIATLARIKTVVRQHISDIDLTLSDIADEVGLSLNYIHKLFHDEGITFGNFLKAERLLAAREMLQIAVSRGMSVTEVSLNCGFSDSSYFSRSFKSAFHMTPRDAMHRP